ncbi:MAG: hypothetical protein Q7U20_09915 [Caulobacter sp.]|nr:hypothetical protein [Caulobacter sp.]
MSRAVILAAALALGLSFAGAASAQTYLSDWNVADMRSVLTASGATVVGDGVLDDGNPYVSGKSASGLKFTATGRVCTGAAAAKRCKGVLLETRFTLDSDAEVEAKIKELDYAAVSIANGGDGDLLVSRYLILDYGVHRENLQINISVFTGIAEDIWGKL